ncbi:glutaredoxin-C3 [Strongylocentrotus purpuratus]|uniref:Glutaredoxin domain-containing protein n=1 Tax=Strongylocentrotus purpuratus TaxID=7668 RepID=A0A7M7LIK9_STRPU|nr:glutaredoxin-C3 [Strongylocentrotus purpuratus]|eukprot:XP_001179256.2 PREDICTED: glutaredoxin-C3 [Strongylocentrotus purpuratus]
MAASSVKCLVQGLIKGHRIMLFSKSYCPFCLMAKSVLQDVGANPVKVLEIEERSDEQEIQDVLLDLTGVRTVPSVFIDQDYLGGGSDLQRMMEEGHLQKLLREKGLLNAGNESSADR